MEDKKYISTREAAQLIGTNVNMINQMVFHGRFPQRHEVDGEKQRRFYLHEVLKWRDENTVPNGYTKQTDLLKKLNKMGLPCSYSYLQLLKVIGAIPKGRRIGKDVFFSQEEVEKVISVRKEKIRKTIKKGKK